MSSLTKDERKLTFTDTLDLSASAKACVPEIPSTSICILSRTLLRRESRPKTKNHLSGLIFDSIINARLDYQTRVQICTIIISLAFMPRFTNAGKQNPITMIFGGIWNFQKLLMATITFESALTQ